MVSMVNDDNVERMIKMRFVVSMGALLPGFGCYLCIAYTYIFQYDIIANFTQSDQCPGVHSKLPPVSYAIGIWEPQRYFWLFIMFLHCPPRIFFLILYRRAFRNVAPKSAVYRQIIYFYMKTMWLEMFGLIAVSVLDIKCSFVMHAAAYSMWIISFNFNMLFNTILHHYGGMRDTSLKAKETTTVCFSRLSAMMISNGMVLHTSLMSSSENSKLQMIITVLYDVIWRIKLAMFISGAILSISTAVSYPVFLAYCFQEAYVAFSIAEYIMVGYNSFFYCLSYWEFPRCRLTLGVYEAPKKIRCSTVPTVSSIVKITL